MFNCDSSNAAVSVAASRGKVRSKSVEVAARYHKIVHTKKIRLTTGEVILGRTVRKWRTIGL